MLYDCWRRIVAERGDALALWDVTEDRQWSFRQLEHWAEGAGPVGASDVVRPQGSGAEFIRAVLRGWRCGAVVFPAEEGQPPLALPKPPEGCVHLKMTSASTGVARTIAFRSEQLIADAENIRATMGLRPEWPNLAAISLGHSYGFSNLVLPLLLHGIPLVLCGSGLPEAVRRGASRVTEATLPGVPVLWRNWLEAGVLAEHIRLGISAGAPLPLSLETEVFRRHGLKVHNFYGASECGGIAYDRSEAPRTDAAYAGASMAGVTVGLAAGGLLEVRSRAVGETYWPEGDPGLGGGRFLTADLAEVRGSEVYLRGRAADLIHVAGRKVAPEAVERQLLAHASVRDCLVVGVKAADDVRGECVAAVVVTDGQVTSQQLGVFLRAHLPEWQIPRLWRMVESLETNVRGKPSRRVWRERLENRIA